jgi:hypothetical protein
VSTSPQMDLLFMEAYSHVLAIFTRNAEPSQMETTVDGFIGSDGFHLRGLALDPSAPDSATQQMDFVIPQDLIAVMRTNQPPTGQPPSPQLTYVSPLSASTATMPQSFAAGWTISISTGAAPPTLMPSQVIGSAAPALVLVFNPAGGCIPVAWTIPAGSAASVAIDIPVPSSLGTGTYYLVAFVPNFPIAVGTYTP